MVPVPVGVAWKTVSMSYSRFSFSRLVRPVPGESARHSGAPVALVAVLLLLLGVLSPWGSAGGAHADESASATASPSASQVSSADTDYDTWSAVVVAISSDLDEALNQYQSGDTTGSAATFQKAYSTGYVASNLGRVVQENLGQDTVSTQEGAFTDLRTQAYKTGNDDPISTGIASLKTSLTSSATTLDGTSSLASPRDYAAEQAAVVATQRADIQANRKDINKGREGRTWTEVADEMTPLIDQAVDKSTSGDGKGGAALINKAYYGYYEKLGFEKTVMAAISGDRVSQVENQFKVVRQAMIAGADASEVSADAEQLKSMLTEDAGKLDGGAAANVNPVKAFFTGSFGQAFIILLREGLEAILVVAAIIAYLIKAGMKDRVKFIYAGILLGLAGSGVVAVLFAVLYESADSHQEILEGVVALIAMAMLLFTSNWMLSKSSVSAWNAYVKDKTKASISTGGFWALASLSFLAVFREGAETVLFYEALFTMNPAGSASIWQGFAAAAVCLVVIFLLIRFTSVKIPLRPFFAITSLVMAVLVVIFAGGGVHALIEGDILPASYLPGWPTYDYLGLYPYRATLIAQVVMAVVVVTLLVVSTVRRRREDRAKAVVEAAEETEEAKTVATRTNEKEDGGAAASAPSAGSADDAPSEDDGTASADEPSSDSASSSSSSSDEEK